MMFQPNKKPRLGPPRMGIASMVSLALVLILVGAALETANRPVSLQSSGRGSDIQLTSGNAPVYQAPELWGGGSPVENCLACTATSLIGSDTAQSIQPDQDVDPATGDFSTTNSLFSVPAISSELSVSLTYDSERSASPAAFGSFGYGWASSFSPSLTVSGGLVTVNEENGAQVQFQQAANDGCPTSSVSQSGDYSDFQKYTVLNSSEAFCAAYRVDAQVGVFPEFGAYEMNEQGGQKTMIFNWAGQLALTGDAADINAVGYNFNVSPGSGGCPSDGQFACMIETDAAGRTVKALESIYGPITAVFDPNGNEYTIDYDGNANLTSISNGGFGNSTWTYGYATTAVSPYNHEMNAVTNPDGDKTQIGYASTGMVTSEIAPTGGTATFANYEQTTCATSAGCPTGLQSATVTYPDGEIDVDDYVNSLLFQNIYGSSATGGGDDVSWTFDNSFTPPTDQDGSTTESVLLPDGSSATIVTDSVGNVTSYTDPTGDVTTSMYNDSGGNDLDELCWSAAPGVNIPNNASCSDPPINSTYYTYDSYGDQLSETDPLGNTTTSGYYTNGLLCWTAPPTVTGGTSCPTTGSSPSGAPVGSTDYTYDSQGDETTKDVAEGSSSPQMTTNTYDIDGRLDYTIPPDGQGAGGFGSNLFETGYSYWGNNNVQSETQPLSRVTSYVDDLAGNVVNQTDPAGATSTAYDLDGRACWTLRSTSTITNPSCGTVPADTTQTSYETDTSAPFQVTDPNGKVTTYAYSDAAFPTKPTVTLDAMWTQITYSAYDQFGDACVSGPVQPSSCSPLSGDTYDNYNSEGQLLKSEDSNGNATTYTYSDADFPDKATQVDAPASEVTSNAYDLDGNLVSSIDPEGNVTSYQYDQDGRLCYEAPFAASSGCQGAPNGSGASIYTYNAANERTQMVDEEVHWSGTTGTVQTTTDSYTYDADGNLLSDSDDNGKTTSYHYDDAKEVNCIAYPVVSSPNCSNAPGSTNSVVDRTYNGAGQLASTQDWLGNTTDYGGYNALSELGTITYPSVTAESLTYGYDPVGNLTSATYAGKIEKSQEDTWTPNADEQVASSSQLGGFTSTNTYSSYHQVTGATNPGSSSPDAYGVQPNGEITSDTAPGKQAVTSNYNSSLGLTTMTNPNTSTTTAYGYDADGQRCWSGVASASGPCSSPPANATQYGWNGYGDMCWSGTPTSGTPSCTSMAPGTTENTYNGDGLRMSTSLASSQSLFTWDLVDGGSIPLDIDDGTYAYVYGPLLFGGTAPVEQINISTGKVTFLASTQSGVQVAFDHAGSKDVLDQQTEYTTYGAPVIQSGSVVSKFGYQGSYTDSSGLIYLINRYYDPSTDQFLSVDPDVAETGQPYAFTGDDPLNATDPLGLKGWYCIHGQTHYYRGNKYGKTGNGTCSSRAIWRKAAHHHTVIVTHDPAIQGWTAAPHEISVTDGLPSSSDVRSDALALPLPAPLPPAQDGGAQVLSAINTVIAVLKVTRTIQLTASGCVAGAAAGVFVGTVTDTDPGAGFWGGGAVGCGAGYALSQSPGAPPFP